MATSPNPIEPLLWKSVIASLVLVLLLIAEIVGITVYTHRAIKQQLEPENLVQIGEETIEKHYPDIRRQLVEEVKRNAPDMAAKASHTFLASSDDVRKDLEQLTERQLDYAFAELTEMSKTKFAEFLEENKQTVKNALKQLDEAPQAANEYLDSLETNIEKRLEIDIQRQAKEVLEVHRRLNDKLDRVTSPKPLTPRELIERRIVRLLKTMEQQQFGSDNSPSEIE